MKKIKTKSGLDIDNRSEESSLVHDPYTGHWIILAPGRKHRPDNSSSRKNEDVFSRQNLKHEKILAVYGRGAECITAIENKFSVFSSNKGLKGRQEILVEGQSKMPFSKFSVDMIFSVINALVERSHVFRRNPQIKYLVAFKNQGAAAGASQIHAHSQIFGLSFVPEQAGKMMQKRRQLLKKTKLTPHDLALMMATKERIIFNDKKVIAFASPFARLPYEVRIITQRPLDNITQTDKYERRSIAKALFKILHLTSSRDWPFNFYFHDTFSDKNEHFEIVFTPRTNVWAGFELDTDIVINPVAPESCADEYRKAG
ncbi:MAG: DUF4931 domain-containing protein [Patescibacteria group bacterium]